jgi:hypothetical protein
MKSEGGEVISTHVQAKQNQQVNLKIVPATGYFLANLSVKLQSGGRDVSTRITVDGQDNMFQSFLMPAGNVVVTDTFEKTASNQNIFIFRAKYGEVVSHVLHADPGQQVNLETRVKNGFTNVELDELYVFNEKGKRLTINTIMDPTEGLVYYFFMEGERAYVFNTFKLPEEPTAINGLQADDEDGDTYDLSGRKVDTSTRLPKGVYIRNGKKIVLK